MAESSATTSIHKPVANADVFRMNYSAVIVLAARILLGIVFLWAGLQKLQYPIEFLDTVYQYRLLGPTPGLLLAIFLPVGEVLLGMCLLLNIWTGGGMLIATALGLVFCVVQGLVMFRGQSVACGCFGSGLSSEASVIGWWTLMRTLVLVGLAIVGYMAWTVAATFPRK